MKEVKLETTQRIRKLNSTIDVLQMNLPEILSQSFWHTKVSMDEKVEYLKTLAIVRSNLWDEIEKTFPQVKGMSYSVNNSFVTYTDETPEVLKETA